MTNRATAIALSGIALLALSACSPTTTDAQKQAATEWANWVEAENQQTRDPERSFLNIVDAIYMRPNENAVLDLTAEPGSIRWYKPGQIHTIAPDHALQLAFDGDLVEISAQGNVTRFESDKYPLPKSELFITTGALHDNGLRAFIRDPNHPKVQNFPGYNYYPYNFDAHVQAEFVPAAELKTVSFQTVQGLTNTLVRVGEVNFHYQGEPVSMSAYHEDGQQPLERLLFLFKDKTNGDTTYGGGRELVVDLPEDHGNQLTLDFNRTFNLNCAHSVFWNCPVIWDPTLPVAVEAGEKLPHGYGS